MPRAQLPESDPERVLISRVKAGEPAALGELYTRFASPLYLRVLLPRLGHRAAAEDALAETFRAALEHIAEFQDRGAGLWAWLARIAERKAVDQYRARGRSGRALSSYQALLGPLAGAETDVSAELELDARRHAARVRARVEKVLARIHPRYRRAIELRFFEECERPVCAEKLEVALSTFDVVLLRALRAFRAEWEKEELL